MWKSILNWMTVIVMISAVVSFSCDPKAGDENNPINSERDSETDSSDTNPDEV